MTQATMDHLPLFADLNARPCLIVGGGPVALRKARQLLRAGAAVTVNAPALHPGIEALLQAGRLRHAPGPFDAALIGEHFLVIAATDDPDTNARIAAASEQAMRLCNIVDDGERSSFIMPAVVDRAPVVVAVGSGGRAPMLARVLRQRLDAWLHPRTGALADWLAAWRQPLRERLPELDQRVAFLQQLLDGPAAAHVLAGRRHAADRALETQLDGQRPQAGEAWLVGAGPGDPSLLTLRALELLQRADAVLHDALVPDAILDLARRDAERVCVGKRGGQPSTAQDAIIDEMLRRVREGQRVCRLKGGDPLVFARGGEELQALAAAGLPFEIVPGVTAASAAAAAAGIPLTHRRLAAGVSFVAGYRADDQAITDWAALARSGHTLAVYMGAGRLAEICAALRSAGLPATTPAALIARAALPEQRVYAGDIGSLGARAAAADRPALLLVGETAALAGELADGRARGDRQAAAG